MHVHISTHIYMHMIGLFRPTSGPVLNYLRAAVGCSLACLAMFFEPFRPSGHASEAIIVLPRYTLASKQMNAHDSREMNL